MRSFEQADDVLVGSRGANRAKVIGERTLDLRRQRGLEQTRRQRMHERFRVIAQRNRREFLQVDLAYRQRGRGRGRRAGAALPFSSSISPPTIVTAGLIPGAKSVSFGIAARGAVLRNSAAARL